MSEISGVPVKDANAIHTNETDEINQLSDKASPVGADVLVIEDSAASWGKKKVSITNLPGGSDSDAIHDNVANEITAITEKTTVVGADEMVIEDSEASFVKKSVTLTNLQTLMQTGVLKNVVEDTTPQLGGNLDLNFKQITELFTAGEALVAGDWCYMNSDGKMWKTDASAEATADTMIAMADASISADATGKFILFGLWTTTGLTAGDLYFLSETTGEITNTRPTTTDAIVRIVGTAISTTTLYIKPDNTYIKVA